MHDARAFALRHAARVLARTALTLRHDDKLVIVLDSASEPVASAIADAGDAAGAWVKRAHLDELLSGVQLAPRPHKVVPDALVHSLRQAHASVFVASALHQEMPMRQALLHLVRELGLRHAHLPGIGERAFAAGLRLDCGALARVGAEALRVVSRARVLTCESAAGTRLRVGLSEGTKWFAQLGALAPGRWGNFPAGALYTSPEDVRGVFVADASLGEFFGAREGLLAKKPVRLTIDRGRVVDVECAGSPDLLRDVRAMLGFSSNSARVGLVAIGVNHGVDASTGEAIVDQNLPGLHLGIGDPAGKSTGIAWSAPTCFAACGSESTVIADGATIVREGRLAGPIALLAAHLAERRTPMPSVVTIN